MGFSQGYRRELRLQLVASFAAMSATDFELLGHQLAEQISGVRLQHRGLTLTGNPSPRTVDSFSSGATVVAEYGTEPDYFCSLAKPQRDFSHAIAEAPQVEIVLLLSNREASNTEMLDVEAWVAEQRINTGVLVDVYDARELADVILDDILPRGRGECIAPFLEPVRRLLREQAASHQVPTPRKGTASRSALETFIHERLEAERVVLLSGISGQGKTETAIAIAEARRARHDRVVWVRQLHLHDVRDLASVDVAQVGLVENLLGMLQTRSCLLVLDDVASEPPLEELIPQLQALCGPDARVLLTSQVGTGLSHDVQMPFLDQGAAHFVLEQDVGTPCPDDIFHMIWENVNGHPLTLQLLNATARERGDWHEVRLDLATIGALPVPQRRQRLANLLVARAREIVEPGLAMFAWVGSAVVHEGLARSIIGPAGIRALHRMSFIASDKPDTLRLHDIVWSSAGGLVPPLSPNHHRLSSALDAYVRRLGDDDSGTLALNHVARLHQPLLARLIRSGDYLDGHLYAWLHHLGPGSVTASDLPDPLARAEALRLAPMPDDFAVQVTAEIAEALIWMATKEGAEVSPQDREDLIRPFTLLVEAPNLSGLASRHAQHHRAKALKRLGQYEAALAALERLLEQEEPLPASQLLMARILTESRGKDLRADGSARAQALIRGLLDEAKLDPERASISVVLATAELLRRHALALDVRECVRTYAPLFERLIIRASERGLEQGTLAFAALGDAWIREDREQFLRVFHRLPLPSPSAAERGVCEAFGVLLKTVASEYEGDEQNRNLALALDFLSRSDGMYAISHAADVLLLLHRASDAIQLIEELFSRDKRATSDPWLLLRLSTAQSAAGLPKEALESARSAVALLPATHKHRNYFKKQLERCLRDVDGEF